MPHAFSVEMTRLQFGDCVSARPSELVEESGQAVASVGQSTGRQPVKYRVDLHLICN
jgi:hypothetical protein